MVRSVLVVGRRVWLFTHQLVALWKSPDNDNVHAVYGVFVFCRGSHAAAAEDVMICC